MSASPILLRRGGALWGLLLLLLVAAGPGRAAYEAEMAAFAAQDAANPPPADVIVFTGSSSITGWSGLAAAFPGYPVLNRGFGGSQMHDVLDKFTNVITPYRAPLYVLYEGDNDIWAGETPAAVFAEYVTFVDRVEAELPGTGIILISVKPSPSRVSRMAAMAELNGLLRDLCAARPNLRFADVFTPMLNPSGQPRPELFGSDMLHMNAAGYAIWKDVLTPLLAEAPFTRGNTFLFDFGSSTAAPEPGWNTVTAAIGSSPDGVLSNLVAGDGSVTAAGLEMELPFNSLNELGTTASAIFPAAATRDSLFGNTEIFEGKADVFPAFRLTGLNPALVYRLTFYASRTGVADNRETLYTVTGASTRTAVLNASENINGISAVSGIAPDAQQSIAVSLSPGPANNSPNHFTYLGVLKVDGLPPPPADTAAPLLLSGAGRSGTVIELTFNEVLAPATITAPAAYVVNGGAVTVSAASLLAGGRVVALSLASAVTGAVTVAVTGVRDTSGNEIAPGSSVNFAMLRPAAGVMLFDFGGTGTTVTGADDPDRTWNNITTTVGTTSTGVLTALVTVENEPTTASFRMIERFNGANANGTTVSGLFPADATSDSLFGNTEVFSGLANIFPAFRLTGLDTTQAYDFTFYASRTGASDNRETRYTLTGTNTVITHLQVANNIGNTASALGVYPSAQGEISVALSPGPNNNNANHFTYIGVMRVSPAPPLDMLPPQLTTSGIRLHWTGTGQLEYADNPAGPWTAILPRPQPPYTENILPEGRRYYRVRTPDP